ncbi:MAG: ATP-dependent RNA helicase RhlB [Desulfobacterales bacterium]|nr:MAG: ATP-dependent RNA helicase RhlB [Desulfobacterales bacterium]
MKNFLSSTQQWLKRIFRPGENNENENEKSSTREKEPPVAELSAATVTRKKQPPRKRTKPQWSLDSFVVPEVEGRMRFHDFPVSLKVMRAIADQKFAYCTPIQEKALSAVLAGRDLVGKANTGTGKTAVFLIAILTRLRKERVGKKRPGKIRALVLAPTRELVVQIAKDGRVFSRYCNLSVRAVYGGVDYQKQLDALKSRACDVLVATPGRLLDFAGKGVVDFSSCSILVLDEADRMLDMGFIPDVRRIVGRLPSAKNRQTMFFSATLNNDVQRLASQWCTSPVMVEAEPEQMAVDTVEQHVYLATTEEKYVVLYNLIQQNSDERIIVFANMKSEARRLAEKLARNEIECVLLSGDVAQNKRMKRLENFRDGRVKVLVATDVAGRGIHIEGITLVVNYTLPFEPEDYVHRIGRTGRAGASGRAVSFADEEGAFYLPEIEDYTGRKFECEIPAEALLTPPPPPVRLEKRPSASSSKGRKGRPARKKHKKRTGVPGRSFSERAD